ncbi:MAG: hypothetical protein JWO82_2257 [Akkermansiaceae bacterium]|nr:hypothetical protein [Akkermansiaceae bacterium]
MIRDLQRWKQISTGVAVVGVVSIFLALLFSGQFLPGAIGEAFGWLAGLMTTPFFMETGLFIIGFCVVILLNHWRQVREGDEFVYLEEVKNAPANLPDQARWAIYKEKPLEAAEISAKDQLEGALAIADYDAALQILTEMPDEERAGDEVVALRIQLAKATGLTELAARLQASRGRAS